MSRFEQEKDAAILRLRQSVAAGDINGGMQALSDVIDLESALIAYPELHSTNPALGVQPCFLPTNSARVRLEFSSPRCERVTSHSHCDVGADIPGGGAT